jgi:hypothetical protein
MTASLVVQPYAKMIWWTITPVTTLHIPHHMLLLLVGYPGPSHVSNCSAGYASSPAMEKRPAVAVLC